MKTCIKNLFLLPALIAGLGLIPAGRVTAQTFTTLTNGLVGYPIFLHNLQPFFLGKDARDLDLLMENVFIYGFNFRYSGMSIGIPLATIEFAILDMLGRIAHQSIGQLMGEIHHPEVAVYQATEYREKSVEESLALIQRDVAA